MELSAAPVGAATIEVVSTVAESDVVDGQSTPPMAMADDAETGGVVSTIAEVEATVTAAAVPIGAALMVGQGANALSAKQSRPSRQGKQVPRWTAEEEEKLRELVGEGEPRGKWTEIAAQMGPERSGMAVEQHW